MHQQSLKLVQACYVGPRTINLQFHVPQLTEWFTQGANPVVNPLVGEEGEHERI